MTVTNSQTNSVKLLPKISQKGSPTLTKSKRPYRSPLVTIDGNFTKRLFDIFFSFFVLVFFSPLYLILAILIGITSPGPIFYVQQRVGKNFQPFNCIKFRTMFDRADEMLEKIVAESPQMRLEFDENFKLKKDPRITKIGHFLRFTSLDEFPQFWNVLKGEMSVVGPRPLVPEELYKYGRKINTVLKIKPGITGLWQVSGRNDIPYPKRVQIDVYYALSHNWLLDMWVIFKTIGVIVFPRNNGAY